VSEQTQQRCSGKPAALDGLLDRLVFAPLEALSEVNQDVEGMAGRGRERVRGLARNARFLGELAVGYGSKELELWLRSLGILPDISDEEERPGSEPGEALHDEAEIGEIPAIDHLIPNYDDLSASQVVRLLAGFTSAELSEIERYESASRHRTTILNRVHQLCARVEKHP
jgi:hypothetical protein